MNRQIENRKIISIVIPWSGKPSVEQTTTDKYIKAAKELYRSRQDIKSDPDFKRSVFDTDIEWAIAVFGYDNRDTNVFHDIDVAVDVYSKVHGLPGVSYVIPMLEKIQEVVHYDRTYTWLT